MPVAWERRDTRFNLIWSGGEYRFCYTNCTHYPKIMLWHTWGHRCFQARHYLDTFLKLTSCTDGFYSNWRDNESFWIILNLGPWEPHVCLPHSSLRNTSASLFVWPIHHQSEFNTAESSEGLWWLKTTFNEDFLPVTFNDYKLSILVTMFIERR